MILVFKKSWHMNDIFFDSWQTIVRTIVVSVLAYIGMIILLRRSGKRTLSKMNAFDFIVTVALGSALANVMLNRDVSLAEGVLAFFLLMFFQYAITWASVRFSRVKNLITSQPAMLLYKGELLEQVLKKERITHEEVHMALRSQGFSSLQEIDLMVLETTGEITIVPRLSGPGAEILGDIKNQPC